MRGEDASKNHSEECRARMTKLLEEAEVTKAMRAKARVEEQREADAPIAEDASQDVPSSSGTVRKTASDRGGDMGDNMGAQSPDKAPRLMTDQERSLLDKANQDAARAMRGSRKRSQEQAGGDDKRPVTTPGQGSRRKAEEEEQEIMGGDDKRYMLPASQGTKRKAEEEDEPLGTMSS